MACLVVSIFFWTKLRSAQSSITVSFPLKAVRSYRRKAETFVMASCSEFKNIKNCKRSCGVFGMGMKWNVFFIDSNSFLNIFIEVKILISIFCWEKNLLKEFVDLTRISMLWNIQFVAFYKLHSIKSGYAATPGKKFHNRYCNILHCFYWSINDIDQYRISYWTLENRRCVDLILLFLYISE